MSVTVYTIPELTGILHMKPRAIRKLLNGGELVGRYVGRQWLVSEEQLQAFLACEELIDEGNELAVKEQLQAIKTGLQAVEEKRTNAQRSAAN